MDVERMRNMLATLGMGWEKRKDPFHDYYLWYDKHGGYRGECGKWRPDEKPVQMVGVVEAMREKWDFHIFTNWAGEFTCDIISKDDRENAATVTDRSFCKAFSMVAACALGMEE